jgi:tetratricopeptide (TPR) repeat protein
LLRRVDPDPAARIDGLRRQQPRRRGGGATTIESTTTLPARAAGRPFVGRNREIEALEASLRAASAGHGQFVAIVGEAGIGKTRTLEEFIARAGIPDDRVLWGRCLEQHGAPAYWPWTQAIGRYVERCDAGTLARVLGRGAADLAQLIPAIGERLAGLEPPPPFDPPQSRLRLFDSIALFLRRTAESEPVVLVLDDLHWADEGSILLLAFLVPELRRSRILMLGTYREREMRRSPRLFGEVAGVSERMPLHGLALEEVRDFVRSRTDGVPTRTLIARLHRVSQGNPFFLDELIRMLRTEGRLAHDDVELGAVLPDEVRQVIRRNLEPLAAEDRGLLATAAVLGYDFDVALLGALCDLPRDRLLERLELACSAGVVEEAAGASGCFRFAHMLVREAFYGDLPALDRARLHRKVGLALEELSRGVREVPCAELARHFVHAAVLGDAAKALDYAARAGEQALARLAYEEAATHFELALKVLRLERADERRDLELRMHLGEAQSCAGDHPRARAAFERAAERARVLRDAATFARAALGFSFATPGVGAVHGTLVALLEESLRMLGEEDSSLRATVLGSLASALYFSRDEERRDALSREAVAMARRVDDPPALARALVQRHHVLWRPGGVADRLVLCDEMIRLATESGDLRVALQGQLWRLVDLLEVGDIAALDGDLERFARKSDQARIPLYRWFAGVVRAARALLDGQLVESLQLADEAATLWHEGPLSLPAQTHALQRFMVYLETRRLGELADTFTTMAREFPALPAWRSGVALIHAESGRPEEACAQIDSLAARDFADLPRDSNFLSALASFALVVERLQDPARAALLYPLLLPHADCYVSVGFAAGAYGACARYLGLLAATMGRLDDAARHLEAALAANTKLGSRPLMAHTQCDYAHVLIRRHETPRARGLLEEARRTAQSLGLTRLLARIAEPGAGDARPRAASGAFRRDGSHWTISYEGRTVRMKHARGYEFLVMLLRSPCQELHVLDLVIGPSAQAESIGRPGQDVQARRDLRSDAGEVIDAQARVTYKRRLAELQEELEEARGFNDLGRIEPLEAEIDFITQELARAISLGGRHRKVGSAAERARINVSRAVASAVKRITDEHPTLGEHLAATVHTGTFCSYTPDPLLTVDWTF